MEIELEEKLVNAVTTPSGQCVFLLKQLFKMSKNKVIYINILVLYNRYFTCAWFLSEGKDLHNNWSNVQTEDKPNNFKVLYNNELNKKEN